MPSLSAEESKALVKNGKESTKSSSPKTVGKSSLMWNLMAFVMIALTLLFACDVLEFKHDNKGITGNENAGVVSAPFTGGIVVLKTPNTNGNNQNDGASEPVQGDEETNSNPAQATAPPTLLPMPPPTEAPKTSQPTNKPIDAAKPNENENNNNNNNGDNNNKNSENGSAENDNVAKENEVPPMDVKNDSDNQNKKENNDNDSNSKQIAVTTTPSMGAGTPSRHTYNRRGQPMSDEDRKAMIEKWGSWTLVDDKKDQRPKEDFYAAYPNRDVPRKDFPQNAWQVDEAYLSKFVPEGLKMVTRAYNAILEEYGLDESDLKFFHVEKFDEFPDNVGSHECLHLGGCTTKKSWENLKRRLLHAIMTEDVFVFAMGGHSSAAGHGNHFTQSYTLQVQWILEAVFARLGVRHQSRNFGLGGLGTIQSGLAAKSIYGYDVDMLLWDSGMTEKGSKYRHVFFRQGILGPGKVPVIMSMGRFDVVKQFGEEIDADFVAVGEMNDAEKGIPVGTNQNEINKMPWAIQYVRCNSEMSDICRSNEYAGDCWIKRDDVTPPTGQQNTMGGRAKWHPGNRKHQSHGRNLSMMILAALKEVFTMWNDSKDYEIADADWHVTSLYDIIRSKAEAMPGGVCGEFQSKDAFSAIMCNTAIKGRTEFTPRTKPDHSSIRSLMPSAQLAHINDPPKNIYEGPDVFNKNLHPPAGALDVLNIVEAGVDFSSNLVPDYVQYLKKPKFEKAPSVPVGKGHFLDTYSGFCDGSVDSWCNRDWGEKCLLYAHNDGRKGILLNSVSGWMVLNLPDVKAGFIALKFETWHWPEENKKTLEWTTVNNERRVLRGNNSTYTGGSGNKSVSIVFIDDEQERRALKKSPPEFCSNFKFEFSIDGKKTVWDKDQFQQHNKELARVVEVVKLVEDPNLTGGKEKEVELAFRMTGCGHDKTFQLTHVYWA